MSDTLFTLESQQNRQNRLRATKDPDSTELYRIDWSSVLVSGTAVSTAVWTAAASAGTITLGTASVSGNITQVIARGGTAGERYALRCRMTTDGVAYTDDQSIIIQCIER